MTTVSDEGQGGTKPRICAFESRRKAEMASLIERNGGIPLVVESMREIPLTENPEAWNFAEGLFRKEFDAVVFLTGVGARALLEVLELRYPRDKILEALRNQRIAVRGPKPLAVLREWNVPVAHVAPEPNTWRELIKVLEDAGILQDRPHIAVQEYGIPNREFYAVLEHRGVQVQQVPVYRWGLPENLQPLRDAIRQIIARQMDAILFTSAQQVHNVLQIADEQGEREQLVAAMLACVLGSIGPTTTETLVDCGLRADIVPEHPKMGHLVRSAMEFLNARNKSPS